LRYAKQAESAAAAEHRVTAGQRFIKACASAHFAEFMDFEHPELKQQARELAMRLFRQALPYLPNQVEMIELHPAGLCRSIILMRRPSRQSSPQPCIILVNGLDSINEVELYGFASAFIERGLSVLMFESPGQGRLCGSKPLPVDFETVMKDVLDHARQQPTVDSQRLGVFGVSFGGYLAARCAALFPRQLRACINLSGGYDYDHFASMPPLVRRNFQFVFGRGEAEIATFTQHYLNLRGVPGLKAPLLSIHGERDVVVPIDKAQRLMDWAEGDKELIVYSNERHVCTNSFPDCIPRMADWMADRLRK